MAADFGVHAMTLSEWMRRADIDEGTKHGTTGQESVELREARRRVKLLEQENEVLRRAAAYGGPGSMAALPGQPRGERIRQEARPGQEVRPARARRPPTTTPALQAA
ncbi:transposase [Streptomyces sp. NPDC021224]|uniref:transposase n=1 Tax=unclassified Streptomyces TaxID=2593676 RepID=UPI0037961125